MLGKFSELFKRKPSAEQLYMQTHQIEYDAEKGYIVAGVVLNDLSDRLEYFSNRKVADFNDLKTLFYRGMMINEKIDLELASGRYVARLGNTEDNLKQLKQLVMLMNDYYRQFKRDA